MHIQYHLTPRARVSAGRSAEVQESRTIHHVLPGTTIRGALGAAWWRSPTAAFQPASPDVVRQEAFDRLFARLVVHEATPDAGVRLRALSQIRHKYPARDGSHRPGRFDLAAGPATRCPVCDAAFDAPRGWVQLDGSARPLDRCEACGSVFDAERGGWEFEGPQVSVTRTALRLGEARDGMLFTRPAVEKTVRFSGTLEVRDPASIPPEAVAWLTNQMALSVGGQKSTLGRVGWAAAEASAPPLPTSSSVVLQLRSPAILVDAGGLPTLDLAGHLRSLPGAGDLACRPWVRPTQVSTWHALAGVPKPVEWALEAGTTAVLSGWSADALARVARGIGLRQLEGFGHVALVDPAILPRFDEVAAPERERGADLVGELAALTHGARQRTIVNGVLDAARHLKTRRESGADADEQATIVDETLALPWARDLGPDARAEVARLLGSAHLGTIITQLGAWRARA